MIEKELPGTVKHQPKQNHDSIHTVNESVHSHQIWW